MNLKKNSRSNSTSLPEFELISKTVGLLPAVFFIYLSKQGQIAIQKFGQKFNFQYTQTNIYSIKNKTIKATTYRKKLEQKLKNRDDIIIKYQSLPYSFGTYSIGTISSKNLGKNKKTLYIRAGIHGEEIAGPLSILGAINSIIDYAHKKNIGVIIHPLANPVAFEKHSRYSDPKNPPKNGNNNVIIYQLANGKYSDDIGEIDISKKRYRSNQKEQDLPLESIFTIKELQKNIKNQNIVAVLDIHQDYITKTKEALTYQYGFGNTEIYTPITNTIKKYCSIYHNQNINAGFKNKQTKTGTQSEGKGIVSDKNGRITRHDGTLGAAAYQLSIPFNITCETTGTTPYKIAKKIHLNWIYGLINLISQSK